MTLLFFCQCTSASFHAKLSSSLVLPEPMRALRGLVATDIQSRQLSLQWENLAFNLTRCHTYSVSLCYRYTTAGGGGGHNTTVRECLAVEHNASRFTLRDLPPYHGIHVRLSLANPEGKKEGREVTFQTEEDSKSQKEVYSHYGIQKKMKSVIRKQASQFTELN